MADWPGVVGAPGGAITIPYIYSNRRDASPTSGQFSWYLPSGWAAGTLLAVPSYTDQNGVSWATSIQTMMNISSVLGLVNTPPFLCKIRVWRPSDPSVFVQMDVNELDDNSTSYIFASTSHGSLVDSSSDPFIDGEPVFVTITPSGPPGSAGGGQALAYTSPSPPSITSPADPGSGNAQYVCADGLLTDATMFCVSNTDQNGIDNTALLALLAASTSAIPSYLHAYDITDPYGHGAYFQVTGVVAEGTYSQISVVFVAGPTFAQFAATPAKIILNFTPTGNKGDTGATGLSPGFGDGSDGSATFDGTNTFAGFATTTGSSPNRVYTLTRDVYLTSMSVSAGKTVNTAGFRIFVQGTLTNAGTIQNVGGAASGTTAGAAAPGGSVAGGGGGAAGTATGTTTVAGTAAGNTNAGYSNIGGRGGSGGGTSPGASGTLSTIARIAGWRDLISAADLNWVPPAAAITSAPGSTIVAGGGTGGGGGGRVTGGTTTATGAGGGGGGIVFIAAKTINDSAGSILATGGAGSNATGGTCSAGGGGGGGGGAVILIYNSLTSGTETANGGALGTGLNGAAAAAAGSAGVVIKIAAA